MLKYLLHPQLCTDISRFGGRKISSKGRSDKFFVIIEANEEGGIREGVSLVPEVTGGAGDNSLGESF